MLGGRGRAAGYTLIEILLVVVIIMVTAGISVPKFAESMKGAKLRTSARSVITAHRYARSTAVLHQKFMAIYFYTEQGKMEVVSLTPAGSGAGEATFGEGPGEEPVYQVTIDRERSLAEGVRFEDVEMEVPGQQEREAFWVNYFPSGTCDAYTLRLEDDSGRAMMVEIDPISGQVETYRD